jgi:hypothetical protein
MLRNVSLYVLALTSLMACSTKPASEPGNEKSDTTTSIDQQAQFLDLDIDQYQVYEKGDNGITLPESDFVGAPKDREDANLAKTNGVLRSGDQLIFTLKNGQQKILKANLQDDENSVDYIFTRSLDAIGHWEVLAFYYESFDYILINQVDGTETHLWNKAVPSPDNKYILCGSVDLEAAFVPTGFQLWSVEDNRLLLRWSKEIENWGAERLIWTKDNYVWGEQTYRDQVSGELKNRLIKMRLFWSDAE